MPRGAGRARATTVRSEENLGVRRVLHRPGPVVHRNTTVIHSCDPILCGTQGSTRKGRSVVPGGLQGPAYGVRVTDRAGRVTVDAQRHDLARQVDGLPRDRVVALEQGAEVGAVDETTLAVGPVGEPLDVRGAAGPRCEGQEPRPGEAQHRQAPRPGEHRLRLLRVVGHPVVQRPVRLQVAHRRALLTGDRVEGRDLFGDLVAQHVVRHVERDPPEPCTVAVGDLGSDHDSACRRSCAHGPHGGGRAGVEPAGDVRGGDHLEQPRVVGDLLTEVGVEVDGPQRLSRHPTRRA